MTLERRRFQRSDTFLIVEFRMPDWTNDYAVGITRNLSDDGFSFESQVPDLQPGNVMEFILKHPRSDLSVAAPGEIVWKQEAWYQVISGIKLSDTDHTYQRKISALISSACDMPPAEQEDNKEDSETGVSAYDDKVNPQGRLKTETQADEGNDTPSESAKKEELQNKTLLMDHTDSPAYQAPARRHTYLFFCMLAATVALSLFALLYIPSMYKAGSGPPTLQASSEKDEPIISSTAHEKPTVQKKAIHPAQIPSQAEAAQKMRAALAGSVSDAATTASQDTAKVLAVLDGSLIRSGQIIMSNMVVNEVQKIIPEILATPDHRIRIEGHTSNLFVKPSSGDQYKENLKLSLLRAKAVASLLVINGISSERISVRGYGDTRPIVSNETHEGREKNRRVEVKLIPGDRTF